MPFVKLDTGILDSTVWTDRDERDIFITSLLMAEPHEVTKPVEQIEVTSLDTTGFVVPKGWYGFIRAAGPGIVRRALVAAEQGLAALGRLGAPDPESRTPDYEGRRLVRVDGGYLILNYVKYREKDHTAAERQRRFRDRKKASEGHAVGPSSNAVTRRNSNVTSHIADADADVSIRARAKDKPQAALPDPPAWIDSEVWAGFVASRKKIRFPLTPYAARLILRQVEKLKAAGADPNEVLDQSTRNGWRDVFEIKPEYRNGAGSKKPPGQVMQAIMDLEAMKSGNRLATGRTGDGDTKAALPWTGTPAGS